MKSLNRMVILDRIKNSSRQQIDQIQDKKQINPKQNNGICYDQFISGFQAMESVH